MTAGADAAPAFARPALKARGVFAAVLGNGFEFFDFTVYATFLGMIGEAFFPSNNALVSDLASAATFGAGFVARPLGGALIGAYGDREGRRPAMTLSIGLMAIGSAIIAITPGYATIGVWAPILLIVARLFQGFAVGGEVGPATMFLLEAAPKDRRMLFASWQLASQNLSSLLGGLIGFLLAMALSQSSLNAWGWRVPFAFGVLIAPVGITIRSQLTETLERPPQEGARRATAILSAVLRSNWRGVVLGLALISGGTITQYFLIIMTPYAIRTLHLPASSAMLGAITLGITGCLGSLAGGALADRWGIRPVVIASRIGLMIVLFPVMKFLVANPSAATLVLAIAISECAARGWRRRYRCAGPVDLPARDPLDRARANLRGRRGDLWGHGDLCRDLAGRRHGKSARFDLLRDGGECGRSPGRFRNSKLRHWRVQLAPPSRCPWIAKCREERAPGAPASPSFRTGFSARKAQLNRS